MPADEQVAGPGGPRTARPPDFLDRVEAGVGLAARASALFGGFVLTGIVLLVVVSVVGRKLFNTPIEGDFELVELFIGVAVISFFPYCQWQRANINVELVLEAAGPALRRVLTLFNLTAFVAVIAFLTYWTIDGTFHAFADGEETMMLAIPIAWGYLLISVMATFLTVIALAQLMLALFGRHK
tara:strand:- start:87 stop:635 length:549 start_codon:yes stop_codon:yes gene_type:complete